jgi:resuscitation-promoting factor RpfB
MRRTGNRPDETWSPPTATVGTKVEQPEPSGDCDPNYSGCVPVASDVDCAGGSGNGLEYVAGPITVIGTDVYDLDRDNDGVACED